MVLEEKYTLSNGIDVPKLGLGTWFMSDENAGQAVKEAVKIGYRHIDTAQAYGNEKGVGEGVRACGVNREDMFVTTKLAAEVKSYEAAISSIDESLFSLSILFSLLLAPVWAIGVEENTMENSDALNPRQQSIIPIAAFTADGDMDRLKPALNQGLDAGLSVNEIKEVLVQLYAYTGFPRSLNALSTFMEVVDQRKAQGIEDVVGKDASPIPPDFDRDAYGAKVRATLAGREADISGAKWQLFSPTMDTFLKEHLFADIFVRDVISHQDRELATIATLANMTGTEGQLGFHLGAAMNAGLTETQMKEFISVLRITVGETQADSTQKILTEVLNNRK